MVNLQYGVVKMKYNICCTKPYKSDDIVEYISSKICRKISIYELPVIYFCLDIKAWNKVYDCMGTGTLTLIHIVFEPGFLMTT